MSLAGCVSASRAPVAGDTPAAIGRQLARTCPTPTDLARMREIAAYLETAPEAPGLDALSTEWERLDEAARKCRGQG